MILNPDYTQAAFEAGSAAFGLLNIKAIRSSRTLAGVHWLPTFFFMTWGLYNLWFYDALHLPAAWWAGLGITLVNIGWLGHVAWYVGRPFVRYHFYRYRCWKMLRDWPRATIVRVEEPQDGGSASARYLGVHQNGIVPLDGADKRI